MVRPRHLLLLLTLATACGCSVTRADVVEDDDLIKSGQWTAADQRARDLLDSVGSRGATRLAPRYLKGFRRLRSGGLDVLVPWPTDAAEALLGFAYERRYDYIEGADVFVLRLRDRPPRVIARDPDQRPADRRQAASGAAVDRFRVDLEQAVERLESWRARPRFDVEP
jgi:hypothetical protein